MLIRGRSPSCSVHELGVREVISAPAATVGNPHSSCAPQAGLFQTIKPHFDCNSSFRIQASLIRPAATSVIDSYETMFLLCIKCETLIQARRNISAPPDKYLTPFKGAGMHTFIPSVHSSCRLNTIFLGLTEKRPGENVKKKNTRQWLGSESCFHHRCPVSPEGHFWLFVPPRPHPRTYNLKSRGMG